MDLVDALTGGSYLPVRNAPPKDKETPTNMG